MSTFPLLKIAVRFTPHTTFCLISNTRRSHITNHKSCDTRWSRWCDSSCLSDNLKPKTGKMEEDERGNRLNTEPRHVSKSRIKERSEGGSDQRTEITADALQIYRCGSRIISVQHQTVGTRMLIKYSGSDSDWRDGWEERRRERESEMFVSLHRSTADRFKHKLKMWIH